MPRHSSVRKARETHVSGRGFDPRLPLSPSPVRMDQKKKERFRICVSSLYCLYVAHYWKAYIQHMTMLPKGSSYVIEGKNSQVNAVSVSHRGYVSRKIMVDAVRAGSSYKLSSRAVALSCKICHATLTCLISVNGAPTAKRRMYSPDRTCTWWLSSRGRTCST